MLSISIDACISSCYGVGASSNLCVSSLQFVDDMLLLGNKNKVGEILEWLKANLIRF